MNEREPRFFEDALREMGYTPIICVGFAETGDGDYRVKVATHSVLKALTPKTWDMLMATVFGALEKMYETPMDDLEIQ